MATGLKSYGMHRDDPATNATLLNKPAVRRMATAEMGFEAAALRALQDALGPKVWENRGYGLRQVSIDRVPFSDNLIVKFRQYVAGIPVFGSLVSVELDGSNEPVSISSTLGDPAGVDHIARITPGQALEIAYERSAAARASKSPVLWYYFDDAAWRLVYRTEDVDDGQPFGQSFADFMVDAHSGAVIGETSRHQDLEEEFDTTATGVDVLGRERELRVRGKTGDPVLWLYDAERNIHTYDFLFSDIAVNASFMPGIYAERARPASVWNAAAVSAHVNARLVADFLQDVLQRNGIDGAGGRIVSSVNCLNDTVAAPPPPLRPREWRNARWTGRQMLYGQRMIHNQLKSYASSAEMVGHELFHGVIGSTAQLIYHGQSGELNESYADIFGVSAANSGQADVSLWEWRIGHEMREDGTAIRSLADPRSCGHPDHMSGYLTTGENLIHKNSSIHNKAAFNIYTSRRPDGSLFFSPAEVLRLFYVTLVSRLPQTANFLFNRRAMILTARSAFAGQPDGDAKIAAVAKAFDDVGIVEPPTG